MVRRFLRLSSAAALALLLAGCAGAPGGTPAADSSPPAPASRAATIDAVNAALAGYHLVLVDGQAQLVAP